MEFISTDIIEMAKNLDCLLGELHPKEISEILNKSVLFGGKRLRPIIIFLLGKYLGVELAKLTPYAICVEQIHAASLAHDDVIDVAKFRRGFPSINAISSNKYAVLAGDYLLADVIWRLAELGNKEILQTASNVIKDLSLGEWIQLKTTENKAATMEDILDVAELKTGSVMGLCAVIPGVIANLSEEHICKLREFGRATGIAFQLIDDTLDFYKTSNKTPFSDLINGQLNAVILKLFEIMPVLKERFIADDLNIEAIPNESLGQAISEIKVLAKQKINEAKKFIATVNGNEMRSIELLLDMIVSRDH